MSFDLKTDFDWKTDTWNVIKTIFEQKNYLVQHQLNSYNDFLDNSVELIISQFNPIILNYDFVGDQTFFKVNEEELSKLNDEELLNEFRIYSKWTEYKNEEELKDIVKQILIKIRKKEKIILDLSQRLDTKGNNNINDKTLSEFVNKYIEKKSINVNNHRYKLEISINNYSLSVPLINENNGRKKLMYPNEARLRNFTYSSEIFVNLEYKTIVREGFGLKKLKISKIKIFKNVNLGKLPIMINSKACLLSKISNKKNMDYEECKYDNGGYFIINGSEKVIVSQKEFLKIKFMFLKIHENNLNIVIFVKLNQFQMIKY